MNRKNRNCDSQGKLGMCPSLAEPYANGFQKTSRRQIKVFWSNNFSKMLARFRASSPDRCPQAAKSPCHAFAYQRAAIAPLPYLNLQPWFSWYSFVWIGQFQNMQLQQENLIPKSYLLRKCGLLAHTSAAFLKNCCTEKLFGCLRLVAYSSPSKSSNSHFVSSRHSPISRLVVVTVNDCIRRISS